MKIELDTKDATFEPKCEFLVLCKSKVKHVHFLRMDGAGENYPLDISLKSKEL